MGPRQAAQGAVPAPCMPKDARGLLYSFFGRADSLPEAVCSAHAEAAQPRAGVGARRICRRPVVPAAQPGDHAKHQQGQSCL